MRFVSRGSEVGECSEVGRAQGVNGFTRLLLPGVGGGCAVRQRGIRPVRSTRTHRLFVDRRSGSVQCGCNRGEPRLAQFVFEQRPGVCAFLTQRHGRGDVRGA